MSSSVKPTAYNMACEAGCDSSKVIVFEYLLISDMGIKFRLIDVLYNRVFS